MNQFFLSTNDIRQIGADVYLGLQLPDVVEMTSQVKALMAYLKSLSPTGVETIDLPLPDDHFVSKQNIENCRVLCYHLVGNERTREGFYLRGDLAFHVNEVTA